MNESTINCQIIMCTVNHPSRIHYPENKKPLMPNMISCSAQGISTGEGKLNINFVVFELKLSRGADKAMGLISRYVGWIKRNLAKDKGVKGVIVANKVDEKLKYASSIILDISLFEYVLNFKIQEVSIRE